MWRKRKSSDFSHHGKLRYKKGFIDNFLQNKIAIGSYGEIETVYVKHYEGTMIGVIIESDSYSPVPSNKFVSSLKTNCDFSFRNIYSETLEEAKLKSDLFLIEQGYKINFPGV